MLLENVLYVPKLWANLISVSQLSKSGLKVLFSHNDCNIVNSASEAVAIAYCDKGIYKLIHGLTVGSVGNCKTMSVSDKALAIKYINGIVATWTFEHKWYVCSSQSCRRC